MAKAEIRDELSFKAPTRIGLLADVAGALFSAGVDIRAIGAYDKGEMGEFLLLTGNNRAAAEALERLGGELDIVPVVVVEVEARPGQLAAISRKLADAGLNVDQVHATTTDASSATIIMRTDHPARVVDLLADV
jgi:hypothetical protein